MTTYTAYLLPADGMDYPQEGFRLVPDTKAPLALFFPPFWLIWHKLWLPLMAYFVVVVAIIILAFLNPSIAVSYLSILPGFYLLLEGYQLVRANLENKGWIYAGVIEAENLEEAEIRFLIENAEQSTKPSPVMNRMHNLVNANVSQSNMSLFPE